MSDERIILTPEEAESILVDGEYVHNYANPGAGIFIGCDFERDGAIEAIKKAAQLEIGGDNCKRMGHGLVVWTTENRPLFFATDAEKLTALEASRMACPPQERT
jgi:hypothetical protein